MGYFCQSATFLTTLISNFSVWALVVLLSNPNDNGEENHYVWCYFSWFGMSLWALPKFVMLWFAAHTLNILSFDLSMHPGNQCCTWVEIRWLVYESSQIFLYSWSNESCWMSLPVCASCFLNPILDFQYRLTLWILIKFLKIWPLYRLISPSPHLLFHLGGGLVSVTRVLAVVARF